MNALPARRLISAILTMLGALVSALMFMSVPALAGVPVVSNDYVSEVTSVGAHLGGTIDPGEEETSYHFEYGTVPYTTAAPHGTSTLVMPLLALDNGEHLVSAVIEGLAGGEYHYRLVASNSSGTVDGPDETFTTQAVSPPGLPDGRQYELVSPPEKDGAQIYGQTARSGVVFGGSSAVQASETGAAMTYMASAPVGSNPAGNAKASQVFSRRTSTGWESQDISPAHPEPVEPELNFGEPFRFFSSDLSQGLLQAGGKPVQVRDNATGVLHTVPTSELPPNIDFLAATSDFSHILINDSIFASADLFEWDGSHLAQVDLLEGGASGTGDQLGGMESQHFQAPSQFAGRFAVSSDGRHVVWGNEAELFSRDMVAGETVRVDKAQGGAGSGEGRFQLASSDGTRVFFTDANELTTGAASGSLYVFDVASEQLTNLTPGAAGGGVSEVLGADPNATSLYVLSTSVLSENENAGEETAVPGANNIFLLHETPAGSGTWSTTFIATLSATDSPPYFSGIHRLAEMPVRVSGNSEFLAFMSDRSLTGYDNEDATSRHLGERVDEEVFLYDAASERLVCASCDPTGARPKGEFETGTYAGLPDDPTHSWEGHWLAGVIPGWNEALNIPGGHPQVDLPLYASRLLSDSGRLFFDSSDGLVAQDVNGREECV